MPVWMQTASLLSMLLPGEEGTYDSNVFNIINKTGYRCPLDVFQNTSAWVTNIATSSCSFKAGTPTFLASRKQEVDWYSKYKEISVWKEVNII